MALSSAVLDEVWKFNRPAQSIQMQGCSKHLLLCRDEGRLARRCKFEQIRHICSPGVKLFNEMSGNCWEGIRFDFAESYTG